METDEFANLSIIIEFVLIGIPLITFLISVFLNKNKILKIYFYYPGQKSVKKTFFYAHAVFLYCV